MRRPPSLLRFTLSGLLATLTLAAGIAGAADLTAIEVTPVDPAVSTGRTLQLVATATFSDGTTADVTADATWASSDRTVARVSNAAGSQGLATGIASGAATISAQFSGVSGATTLTVTDPTLVAIEVTPASARLAVDFTLQYTATGLFSDGSSQDLSDGVTWSSSELATARISNAGGSEGLATGLASGMTIIQARFGSVTGSTSLTVTNAALVSVAVTPSNPSVAAGRTVQFTAIGTFSDGSSADLTEQGSWASATGAVASVSNASGSKGLATGLAPGTSTISMELDGITGSTVLTVTSAPALVAIEVTPAASSVEEGASRQLTATAIFSDGSTTDVTEDASWSSDDDAVATVSNAAGTKGIATGVASGMTTIRAAFGGATGATSLTVTEAAPVAISVSPSDPSVTVGSVRFFTAIGTYANGATRNLTQTVVWSSSAPATATVSNAPGIKGRTTGIAPGTTDIRAELDGIAGATTLTVTAAPTLVSIEVTPIDPTVMVGLARAFTATATFSDGSTTDVTEEASWDSSDTVVAAVSNAPGLKGIATGVAPGMTTIRAETGGVAGSTTLTVTASVCGARPFVCKAAGKASLRIENRTDDRRDRFEFTWARGDATTMAELGDPTRDTQYAVCVWDDVGGTPTLVMEMVAPPAGSCIGRSCWRSTGFAHGFRYFDAGLLPNGLREIAVKPGPLGRPRVVVKALGDALPDPPMPFRRDPTITVQVVNSAGSCWGTDFVTAPTRNTAEKLVAQERP